MRLICPISKSISHDDFMKTAMLQRGQVKKIGEGKFGARQVRFTNGLKATLKFKLHSNEKFHGVPKNTQHLREVAAYILDWKFLHFDLIPPTALTVYKKQQASIAYWVEGLVASQIVKGVFNKTRDDWKDRVALFASKVDADALRRSCILDLVINNTDRHAKNCLFDPFHKRVWCIDHGLAFAPYFKGYYSVFHRFLFRKKLFLEPAERTRLSSITHDALKQSLKRYLSAREIEETYFRIQWVLEQPNLAFESISGGKEGKTDFPSKEDWFKKQTKKGPRNRVIARVADMGGIAVPGLT